MNALMQRLKIYASFADTYLRTRFPHKNIRVGIVTEEFFHEDLRGFGGFGMTVKNITDYYNSRHDNIKYSVLLSSRLPIASQAAIRPFHRAEVLLRSFEGGDNRDEFVDYVGLINSLRLHVLLTIDFYPTYNYVLKACPHLPVIIYIRDPRGQEEWEKLGSMSWEIKQRDKNSSEELKKLSQEKADAIQGLLTFNKKYNRKIIFASNGNFLTERARHTYNLDTINPYPLLNPLILPQLNTQKDVFSKPSLCFIGRLDAQKRFWIVFELAKRFPEIDFYICGDTNRPDLFNTLIDRYRHLPNLKLLGVVTGDKKFDLIRKCWGLINTSIHEGLPVTFLEAFMYAKPVISCLDPDGLVSRFGYFTGEFLGEGMQREDLQRFEEQINCFLQSPQEREQKGKEARLYMEKNHTFDNFGGQLRDILKKEGIMR